MLLALYPHVPCASPQTVTGLHSHHALELIAMLLSRHSRQAGPGKPRRMKTGRIGTPPSVPAVTQTMAQPLSQLSLCPR